MDDAIAHQLQRARDGVDCIRILRVRELRSALDEVDGVADRRRHPMHPLALERLALLVNLRPQLRALEHHLPIALHRLLVEAKLIGCALDAVQPREGDGGGGLVDVEVGGGHAVLVERGSYPTRPLARVYNVQVKIVFQASLSKPSPTRTATHRANIVRKPILSSF